MSGSSSEASAEDALLWMLYAGALAAMKLQEHALTTRAPSWRQDLRGVAYELAARGLRL